MSCSVSMWWRRQHVVAFLQLFVEVALLSMALGLLAMIVDHGLLTFRIGAVP